MSQRCPRNGGLYCCYIYPDGRCCEQKPRFEIFTPPWTYHGYTHACGDHVESLKETDADQVVRLEDSISAGSRI